MNYDKMTIKDISLWLTGFGLLFASFSCWAGNSNVLTAGYSHTCGLKTDGTIACWGYNSYGQIIPPSGSFTQISAGLNHNCGLKTDRTISCWGQNNKGQSSPPPGTYLQVAAGNSHTCALKTDSTVICWGDNSDSQSSPLSGTFTQITAGNDFTCGLRANKTVECWGASSGTPPANSFTYISAGRYYNTVCGLKTDGTGTCWGGRSYDTLGFISQLDTGIGSSSSSSNGGVCGIKTDKTVECWGLDDDPQSGAFTYVAVGASHACGIRDNGLVACWGSGSQATPPTGVTFKQPGGTVVTPPSTACSQTQLNAQYSAGYKAGVAAAGGGGVKITNISTRALVHGGAYNVIAGFIVTGTGAQKVVIRGWGIEAGVDPTLTLQTFPEGTTLAINNSWQADPHANKIPAQMKPTKATDAALFRYLAAGAYTAILSTTGGKGLGLIGVNAID